MKTKDKTIQRWWPSTQSLDLVEGPIREVATAVKNEVSRYVNGEVVSSQWESFPSLNAAFQAAPDFTNVPTFFLVLPTNSKWTVLWNNSFLCDGYDSLCSNLTSNYGFTTIHWAAHDDLTTFQTGTAFTFRKKDETSVISRTVQVAQQDNRWMFFAIGNPLPEEELSYYSAKRKRDRFNEEIIMQLLARLGASPWSEDFYNIPDADCFVLSRVSPPTSVIHRGFAEVQGKG